ncbi:hypothetical protein [Larkinella ripae]
MKEVQAISSELARNLKKICLHGRRDVSMVKGNRKNRLSSTGKRQATDLNTLTSDYLKLVNHGFRAREKDFTTN